MESGERVFLLLSILSFFFFFKTVETLEDIAVVEEPVKKKSRKNPVSIRQREDPKNVGVNGMHSIGRG